MYMFVWTVGFFERPSFIIGEARSAKQPQYTSATSELNIDPKLLTRTGRLMERVVTLINSS
jgi:hypothetical protein